MMTISVEYVEIDQRSPKKFSQKSQQRITAGFQSQTQTISANSNPEKKVLKPLELYFLLKLLKSHFQQVLL